MPCPISLLFINLHGSRYLVAARLCPGAGGGEKLSGAQRAQGSLHSPVGTPRSSPKTRGAPCEGESSPGRRGKGAAGGSGLWDAHRGGVGALALTPPGWAALCPSAPGLGWLWGQILVPTRASTSLSLPQQGWGQGVIPRHGRGELWGTQQYWPGAPKQLPQHTARSWQPGSRCPAACAPQDSLKAQNAPQSVLVLSWGTDPAVPPAQRELHAHTSAHPAPAAWG